MKRIIRLLVCVVLSALMLMTVAVADDADVPEFSLDLGREYRYFEKGDDLKEAAEITGMKEEELEALFEEENLLMLALSKDNERQVKVSYYKNELSEKIGNLSAMSTEDVRKLSKELYNADEGASIDVVEVQARKYMLFSELLSDSGGDYIAAQYITVADGYFWHITTYGPPHNNVAIVLPYFIIGSNGRSVASTVLHIVSVAFGALALVMLVLYFIERKKEKAVAAECAEEQTEADPEMQENIE